MPSGDHPTAIVVGAGVWGAATAAELIDRGWQVTMIEQWAPANARGSSGDRTRMTRVGYSSDDEATDLWYARSARGSAARWADLEAQEGISLLHPVELVWLAASEDGPERALVDRLRAVGLEPEVIAPDRLPELFPAVNYEDLAFAVLEPEVAIIRATAAVEALIARAVRGGARLMLERAEPAAQSGSVRVGDRVLGADRIVWACGSWLGRLFPGEAPIAATWQDVLHWHARPCWRSAPAWFDEHAQVYGVPDLEGLGLTAATHRPGRPLDPDLTHREVDQAAVAAVSRYLARRFPDLAEAALVWGRVMPYEMTPDANFVIGFRPGDERSLIAGGGSGHGFKHALTVGQHVADLIEGRASPVEMFALGPRMPKTISR
ncbi:MAG TPA: FAD-dependent oxidoreductase [Solirubrobacteraceae bacterium]